MATPRPPQRVTSWHGPWRLHDAAASRVAEQQSLAGTLPGALMARAGLAVARLALALAPQAERIVVWAGPGNNGGDGLIAARHLHAAGKAVRVLLIGDPARQPADAARALQAAMAAGVSVHQGVQPVVRQAVQQAVQPVFDADLAIDALLGLGTTRAPSGDLAAAISAINTAGCPVLAVDLPSGLHPDTGTVLGDAAVRATATLALLSLKPGCFTHQGRDHAGAVWFDDLDLPPQPPSAWLIGPPLALPREHAAHKGRFGDVAVVGGAPGMVGAAWLAAGAALAAGAGRVYCSLLADDQTAPPALRPELMSRRRWWLEPPGVLATCTVVCGCGGGDAVRSTLPPLLSHAPRLVLDADALNAVAADAALQQLLKQRQTRGLHTLLTPHPLEAARLLRITATDVQRDRLAAALALARALGVTVLLKGSGSVIVSPDGLPSINSTGNAALATAGTGDVLAGWAGGLWAQQPAASAAAIARAAAWQHGHAADRHAELAPGRPLRAGDLIEALAGGR